MGHKRGGLRSEAARVSRSFRSDREYGNDLVVEIHDDDLVADHEVPESTPLGMDFHDDRRDFDHAHARRHHGAHADREVDVRGTRYIAAGQDRLSDLGALLRGQGRAATARLALLRLALRSLSLLTGLALLTLLSLRGLPLALVSLLALRLSLLALLALALARGLIPLLPSLATLLGLTLLAAILLQPLIALALRSLFSLGRLAGGLSFLSALRLALLLLLFLRALLRLTLLRR